MDQRDVETEPYRFRYVPALDGLRAVAVGLVLLFHYPWQQNAFFHPNPYRGGFLGVDVFFVLSGFLITSLLLQEHEATGRVSLRNFYIRRALRLGPPIVVLVLIGIVAQFAFLEPGKRPSWLGIGAMLGYFANWVQLWTNDPLGGLFGHTWSLAIEEQFYLFFPILFVVLLRLRLRRFGMVLVLLAGAAISAVWRIHLWGAAFSSPSFVDWYAKITGRALPELNPFSIWNRWYFGTDTRLDALLVGCAAAVLLHWFGPSISRNVRRMLLVLGCVALIGAGAIINEAFILSDWLPRWGLPVLEVCIAIAVVALCLNPRSWPARFFAMTPLVWIGRRSYAIYLFHLLVFNEMGYVEDHVPSYVWFWLNVAVLGIVAALSWRFLEQPFLKRKSRYQA